MHEASTGGSTGTRRPVFLAWTHPASRRMRASRRRERASLSAVESSHAHDRSGDWLGRKHAAAVWGRCAGEGGGMQTPDAPDITALCGARGLLAHRPGSLPGRAHLGRRAVCVCMVSTPWASLRPLPQDGCRVGLCLTSLCLPPDRRIRVCLTAHIPGRVDNK